MKSSIRVFFEHIIFFLIFVIILGMANYLSRFFGARVLEELVYFFNSNMIFLFFIMIISLTSHILWNFNFPINLPAPIFGGFSGVLIVIFLLDMSNLFGFNSKDLLFSISALVFIVIVFIGYIKIIARLYRNQKEEGFNLREVKKEIRLGFSEAFGSSKKNNSEWKLKKSKSKKEKSEKNSGEF